MNPFQKYYRGDFGPNDNVWLKSLVTSIALTCLAVAIVASTAKYVRFLFYG